MSEKLAFELPVAPPSGTKLDLLSLDDAGLLKLLVDVGEKPFRARQLFAWLHDKRVTSFAAMTDLSAALRQKLEEKAAILRPVVDDVRVAEDGTRKYQLKTHDGHIIESVWIPHASGPAHHALCISSQVGCAMGCTFCATAALKLTRHLSAGEIVGQVYAVLEDLAANLPVDPPLPPSKLRFRYDPETEPAADVDADDVQMGRPKRRIQNIVYMGMGEPLHNLDNVIASVNLLTHDKGMGLSPRRITVSTSGVVSALPRLGAETGVHLAISLNATTNEVRKEIMPVTKRWSIEQLLDACRAFPAERRRRLTFEYVLLKGVNDGDVDARRLVQLLKPFKGTDKSGEGGSKVNLIPFNAHPLSPFGRPDDDRVEGFRRILDNAGVACFVRTTRGLDIDAACGMLGAKKLEDARKSLPVVV
ncbi:MAG: 23S rRNA (adenine(2503)-C(2))-methyltransferase RlmN [Deltaproteobacteria bacterium]|nr:23S rRNA (adenine(2503)-C(2))-methyltransferase RlmN [Deltaproteobacteria bacterium]